MDSIYRATIPLPPYEIDIANRLRLSAFFRIVQQVASTHASLLGLGYEALSPLNLFWVLSWARIEIQRFPSLGESISITTWPKMRQRLFSIRDILFQDPDGRDRARMTTAWLLLDGKTWRIVPLERLPHPVAYQNELSALPDLPGKLHELTSPVVAYTKKIVYSDLDLYGHVNNACYVDFILDAYAEEYHCQHPLRALTISYRSEARFGEDLDIRREVTEGDADLHRLEIFNRQTGKIAIQAEIRWDG